MVVYLVLTKPRNVGGPVSGKRANWLLPVQWKLQPGLWKRAAQLLRHRDERMSSRNFTFLHRAPFSLLRSISRCGAHRSPSAQRANPLVLSWAPSRRAGGHFEKDEGFDGSCERAYSIALARKENARRKDGKRGKKKAGKRKSKIDESRGKQKRTKAHARDDGGLKNDIHRETKWR